MLKSQFKPVFMQDEIILYDFIIIKHTQNEI